MTIIDLGNGILIDVDCSIDPAHNESRLLLRILAELKHQQKQIKDIRKNMVPQSTFDTSLTALTNAVSALAGGTGTPSTPDSVVQAYISGVDTNTAHLQALATPTPPPAPAPAPTA